jgi:hypothetical protein
MLRTIFATGSAVALLCMQALAGTVSSPAATPYVSGTYLFTSQTICQPQMTVSYANDGVAMVSLGSSTTGLQEGTYKFTPGTNPLSGTVTVAGLDDYASPVLVVNSGISGSSGTPMTQQANAGSLSYSLTATTITILDGKSPAGSTYNIYPGKVVKGIVQNAVYGGLDDQGCAEQGTITLK